MATAEGTSGKLSDPPVTTPALACQALLEGLLEQTKKGEIMSVVIGYVQTDGGAQVRSTAMSPVMLNHVSKLLERRVNREYDRALAKTSEPRAPVGPMHAPGKAPELPRKVRRQIDLAREKEAKRLAKKAKQQQANGAAIVRRPTTTG